MKASQRGADLDLREAREPVAQDLLEIRLVEAVARVPALRPPTSCGRGQSSSSRPSASTKRMPTLRRVFAAILSARPIVWKTRITSSSKWTARGR